MSGTTFEHDDEIVAQGVDTLVVAGWTGRDAAGVEHHIRELEALGVAPPSSVPLFYRVSAGLLGAHSIIEVVGEETSGEVEPMLVRHAGRLWLGLASDHTDRALETHSVALSKQGCAKPCAATLWSLDGLADAYPDAPKEGTGTDANSSGKRTSTPTERPTGELVSRLDALELRAWIADDLASDDWTLYQEGSLAAIRPLAALLATSPLADPPTDSPTDPRAGSPSATGGAVSAMLCGTLPAIGGVRPASAFRFELLDPANGRSLRHGYAVRCLPEIR